MDISIILALLSGFGTTVAYVDYNRVALKDETKPNGATWAIWSTIALISSSSYFAATGDVWKTIILLLNIVLCTGTFVLVLMNGKFKKLDNTDWYALAIGIIAVVIWKFTTASCANLIVQVAIIIGFIPTWHGIWKSPSCEKPRPWWIWCVSYGLAGIVVILRWKGQWIDLIYPWLCVFLHASVPIVGTVSKKLNKQPTEEKMPIIKVWCLPKNIGEARLINLCMSLIATVESVPELDLVGKDAITVLFPSDRMEWGLGEEIIAEVAIFNKPERTEEVRARLAEKVGTLLHDYFPSAKIECFIHPLERASGFWKIHPFPNTEQLTEPKP